MDDINDESLLNEMKKIQGVTASEGNSDFILPFAIGGILGLIIGLGCGIVIMKKKK